MKKMGKKVLSFLLATVMVIGIVPLSGFVGLELPSLTDVFVTKAEAATEYTEGIFTYIVTENEATITRISAYSYTEKELIIPETINGYTVTKIDSQSKVFTRTEYPFVLKISNTVKEIAKSSFYGCEGITAVHFSDSVESIGPGAFWDCEDLELFYVEPSNRFYCADEHGILFNKSKTRLIQAPHKSGLKHYSIPESVLVIDRQAFYRNKTLEYINIPKSVEYVGPSAFNYCLSLSTAIVCCSQLGERAFYSCSNLKDLTISSDVVSIGDSAFSECTSLESVYIPAYTSIEEGAAFEDCSKLKEVILSDGISVIGDSSFKGTAITTVNIPESVRLIGDFAFSGCGQLNKVVFEGVPESVGYQAFYCAQISEINLPYGMKSIGQEAFSGCDELSAISIPDTVVQIGQGAFRNTLYSKTDSNWDNSVLYISNHLVDCRTAVIEGEYVIKDGTVTIADNTFRGAAITKITIPDSVKYIGESAFYASEIEKIEIGSGVIKICKNAFSHTEYSENSNNWYGGNLYIKNYLINAGQYSDGKIREGTILIADNAYEGNKLSSPIPDSVKYIGSYSFADSSAQDVIIPDSVLEIGNNAFDGMMTDSITIGKSVKVVGNNAFRTANKIFVDKNNEYFSSDSYGVLFNKDKTELIRCPKSMKSYNVPESVMIIQNNAFSECLFHLNITIPSSVKFIGEEAFCSTYITEINIPSSVEYIGTNAFKDTCDDLQVVFNSKSCNFDESSFEKSHIFYGISGSTVELYAYDNFIEFHSIDYTLSFENAEYFVNPDKTEEKTYSVKLNCIPANSNVVFNKNKLNLNSDQDDIIKIEDITYTFLNDKIEVVIDIDPIKSGECVLFADYDGIKTNCEIKVEKTDILVYTTQPSLSLDIGEKMGMGFALSKDGEIEEDWKNMAIVVSDPTVLDVSDYLYSEQGYYINFTGKTEGTTTVTVTDSESGAYVTFLVKVVSGDAMCRSYKIDEIPEYYPEIWGCRETKTNFYDVSGLYVNQYKQGSLNSNGKYPVSFNVYNSEYHFGSVDVYDANGKWIQSVCIDKYAKMPESVLETADQLFYLIKDGINKDWFSYEANHYAKKTTVEIEVPKGGYFTITNNMANSPGTILYNAADFMAYVLNSPTTLINMNNAVDDVVEDIISDDAIYDAFMSALMNIGANTAGQAWSTGTAAASNAYITDIEGLFESLGLGFDSFCSTAAGIAQDVFLAFDSPFGKVLEACFKISEFSNITCQMLDLSNSDNNVYLAIHTNESAQDRVMNGVIVDGNGDAIDREAVLQVFRVTDVKMEDIVISNDTTLTFDDYVTYNICFIKDETEVQPNGKVQVKIPIPEGMDKSDCCVLRQEKNGTWSVLNARVEGNYLVFETDHFSLYAVAGNYADSIKINSMPAKLEYNFGEYIDTTDMSIEVTYDDGRTETITDGIICTPARLAESGTQVITVSYGKTTTTFTVEVTSNIELSVAVANPTTTKISYGDSIILHAEITGELPEGATVQWFADNSCFDKAASNDGMTCRITPKSSGSTTFTVKIVSAEGEILSEDTQEMTAKAGIFDKIIGFFKSLFGLSKIYEQVFKVTE